MSKGIVNPEEVMQHVEWFSMSSLDRYSQMSKMVDSSSLSQLFSNEVDSNSAEVSGIFKKFGAF
jgi:DNA-binding transcriptional regulator YdaS (Cro superfamily)